MHRNGSVARGHLLWLCLGALVGACGTAQEEETSLSGASQRLNETAVPLPGRIVVNHDEWTLSNSGFSQNANAAAFARNVAQWFTGGRPGRFLVYSSNFGLRESALAAAMTQAGHSWSAGTSVPFTLATFSQYDGVFFGGTYTVDTAVMTQYVQQGGNIYLMAGTGTGGAPYEASVWNPFLASFGLRYAPAYNGICNNVAGTSAHPVLAGVPSLYYCSGNSVERLSATDPNTAIIHASGTQGLIAVYDGRPGTSCFDVRLSSHNLFLLEDYNQGHDVQGKVAAGGDITLTDFAVGAGLSANDPAQVLVAGGDLNLSRGGVFGDAWYGGTYTADPSVTFARGTASQGTPIDFQARFTQLRALSTRLAGLEANGTTTVESWGGVMLHGNASDVNVFQVDASSFTGATLLSIHAPAGSLVVVNISGASATFSGFGHSFSGGIDQHGVLYNFVDATAIHAENFGFWGTVLAPLAHIDFNSGSWDGGIYARSLTGNAEGHINPLTDRELCPAQ
jgi:choice-of-anchor A domain-containing protein